MLDFKIKSIGLLQVIGVPQPTLKWYKDGRELKPGDIHRIISGQDGTCCLGTYTCEASNCMGTVASSASLLGFEGSHFTILIFFSSFIRSCSWLRRIAQPRMKNITFITGYMCVFLSYSWVFCYSSLKHFRFMILLSFNRIASMSLQASNKRYSFSINIYKKPFSKRFCLHRSIAEQKLKKTLTLLLL